MTIPTQDTYAANGRPSTRLPVGGCTDLQATGTTTNITTALTMPATTAGQNVCSGVFWSYSAAPAAAGRLIIDDGAGNVVYDQYVAAQKGYESFDPPLAQPAGAALQFQLTPGGAGVTGKVRPNAWVQK